MNEVDFLHNEIERMERRLDESEQTILKMKHLLSECLDVFLMPVQPASQEHIRLPLTRRIRVLVA